MKLSKHLCLLATSFSIATAFQTVDLASIGAKPHSVNFKRDAPANIIVTDSDTLPIEDGPLSGLATKPHSQVVKNPSTVGSSVTSTKTQLSTDNLKTTTSLATDSKPKTIKIDDEDKEVASGSPFLMSISMIIVSEIGDKTFLISALMAMRHSRALVFSASFSALFIMTVLSGVVGHALPSLISQRVTQLLAAVLFVVFGFKLTKEGLAMSKDLGVEEELAEVEEEISVNDMNHNLDDVEGGGIAGAHQETKLQKLVKQAISYSNFIASQVFSPLWIQVFGMNFLGEWGDRSQIATIAMAAGSDYWPVIWGAVIGHGLCTGAAVIGGKMLASRISMRTVTLGGAFAFFVFAILYFYESFYGTEA